MSDAKDIRIGPWELDGGNTYCPVCFQDCSDRGHGLIECMHALANRIAELEERLKTKGKG